MLRCTSLHTFELDDAEAALQQLQQQLDDFGLLEHSVGILMCHAEFTHTDVLDYVCSHLPFETVGVTTASQAVHGATGELLLTIFVITADDATFRVGLTDCLQDDVEGPTAAAFAKTADDAGGPPALILAFPPLLLQYAGDIYPNVWSKLAPTSPVFGTLALDDTVAFSESETLHNGSHYTSRMPFVLCYGNIHPRFAVATIDQSNMMPYSAEITDADGPIIHGINNTSAFDYFKSIGLAKSSDDASNFLFMPLFIDFTKRDDYDGVPVMRVLTQFTDNGSAVLRGNADVKSVVKLSTFTQEAVLESTRAFVHQVTRQPINGLLSFSCIIRRMAMQSDPLLEANAFAAEMPAQTPYMFGYAGGEICPTSQQSGMPSNRFHNYTLVNLIL